MRKQFKDLTPSEQPYFLRKLDPRCLFVVLAILLPLFICRCDDIQNSPLPDCPPSWKVKSFGV